MKTQNTFYITGLTCNNCAKKVKGVLEQLDVHAQLSADLSQITIKDNVLSVEKLNAALSKIGQYKIGDGINMPVNAASNIEESDKNTTQTELIVTKMVTYQPLILVFSYILLVCFAIELVNGDLNWHRFMPNFMAGFFLVFSFFKLLDLSGFASSYAMYDVIAKRMPAYAYLYPFIELGLGAAYLLAPSHAVTSAVTLVVMLVSLIGVVQAVLSRQKIKCACLGTGFNLPMTTVTIVEDSLMAAMAAWMLI